MDVEDIGKAINADLEAYPEIASYVDVAMRAILAIRMTSTTSNELKFLQVCAASLSMVASAANAAHIPVCARGEMVHMLGEDFFVGEDPR